MPPLQTLLKQREPYQIIIRYPQADESLSGLNTALTCGPPNNWKVLVVDDYSKALLESVYELFDILHMNITGMFSLHSTLPLHAIRNDADCVMCSHRHAHVPPSAPIQPRRRLPPYPDDAECQPSIGGFRG